MNQNMQQMMQQQLAAMQKQIQRQGPGLGGISPGPNDGGIGLFTGRYQREPFGGEDAKWHDWSDVCKSWMETFFKGNLGINMELVDEHRDESATVSDMDAFSPTLLADLTQQAAQLYHVLVMSVRGKAVEFVWRAGGIAPAACQLRLAAW